MGDKNHSISLQKKPHVILLRITKVAFFSELIKVFFVWKSKTTKENWYSASVFI